MQTESKKQKVESSKDAAERASAENFDLDLIMKYPRSNRKVQVNVRPFSLSQLKEEKNDYQTIHISPHGMQFRSSEHFPEGTLLKIDVAIPNYWERKQRFVEYGRIDSPSDFKVLAKVVKAEDLGKRGKKNVIVVKTVNMDDIDEQVLKTFLQEG